jgi:site-specific recombinase
LFLSGLVSGYFDNQARYRQLAERVTAAPGLAWLGKSGTARAGRLVDEHYGAVLGNVFFAAYLGAFGVAGALTGLPLDIRHVAFSSAAIGIALPSVGIENAGAALGWSLAGVVMIGIVNLFVSFGLALYVAMRSRSLGSAQVLRLGALLARRFARQPLAFLTPPA